MHLKEPFRFDHTGVRGALRALHAWLDDLGGYAFGSSGDGELTIRGATGTAYVRKLRDRPGWTATLWRGEHDQTHHQFEHLDAVVAWVNKTVDPAD